MGKSLAFAFVVMLASLPAAIAQTPTEQGFLQRINDHRLGSDACWSGVSMIPWPPQSSQMLTRSPTLSEAARQHNLTMIATNCTLHTCPGEPSLDIRATSAGYPFSWGFLSENIAGGFETTDDVFEIWSQSNGHNRNMLSCRAHAIGISMVYEPRSLAWWYWTTDFGDVVDGQLPPPSKPAPPPAPKPTPPPAPKGVPLVQALDRNLDGIIGDADIVLAMTYWVVGSKVPDTEGAVVGDKEIKNLMTLWVMGQPY